MRLLLVEDNDRLSEFLEKALHDSGFTVDRCATVTDADAALAGVKFDATIMDLGLPDGDGLGLVKTMRTRGDQTPVLVLTARDGLSDRVNGLNTGADDYMVKPFAMEELIARVKALLRRGGAAAGSHQARVGDLTVDFGARVVRRGGEALALRPKEFDLLAALVRHRGRVVSRAELLRDVFGYSSDSESRTVETHVAALRDRLGDDPVRPRYVVTVRGAGYRIAE